jgi:Xaa-Pro aminopeptidase
LTGWCRRPDRDTGFASVLRLTGRLGRMRAPWSQDTTSVATLAPLLSIRGPNGQRWATLAQPEPASKGGWLKEGEAAFGPPRRTARGSRRPLACSSCRARGLFDVVRGGRKEEVPVPDIDVVDAREQRSGLLNRGELERAMREQRFDAVVASSLFNVTYTSGCLMVEEPLPTFVVTEAGGRQGLVVNEADAHYFRAHAGIEDIRDYRFQATTALSIASAVERLGEMLRDFRLDRCRVGFELQSLPAAVHAQIAGAAGFQIADAGPAFERARLIKTPGEIELLRLGARHTEAAIRAAFQQAKAGDTEAQITAEIQCGLLRSGASALAHARALAGVYSTVAHAWPLARPVVDGEVIHVDFGGYFAGYCSDIGRNAVVGRPGSRQNERYQRLHEVCEEMVDAIRPGVTAGELHQLGERAMAAVSLVYPWGTYGHSIGLSGHEGFEITAGGENVLLPGMVLNVEPSHIETGDARYQVEETVAVTETGATSLAMRWWAAPLPVRRTSTHGCTRPTWRRWTQSAREYPPAMSGRPVPMR